jgi:formylglycine-generating enzyme required for sulfatase activity
MTFCWIPPGIAALGSPKAARGAEDESEAKRGEFKSRGFWLAKYPVTQAEWTAVTGANPSYFRPGGPGAERVMGMDTSRLPVEQVSWDNAREFLERLDSLGGADRVFGVAGWFALPHEDEWEYACRGGKGNDRPFYWGAALNGMQANCNGNHPHGTTERGKNARRPTIVGTYATTCPHPWGLCDMHGNVWEWCDNSDDRSPGSRVIRGGAWSCGAHSCHAASRGRHAATYSTRDCGLRVLFRPA